MENDNIKTCALCSQTSQHVPLLPFRYQERELWLCPAHLPTLIHEPEKLAGKLPGAENLSSAPHHDDCGH